MTETKDKSDKGPKPSSFDQNDANPSTDSEDKPHLTKQQRKEEKLAQALRDNLRRRKANS